MKTKTVSRVEEPSVHLALMLGKIYLMGLTRRQALLMAEILDLSMDRAPNDRGSTYNHTCMASALRQINNDGTSTIITSAKSRKR